MIRFLFCTSVLMILCFFTSRGFRLAGPVRSQLVRLFAVGSCLETFCGLSCVFSIRCVIFRNSDDLLHHLWYVHVDDLCDGSFRDTLWWNVVNNFNGRMSTIYSEHCVSSTSVSGIISSTSSSVSFSLLRLSVSLGKHSQLHASVTFAY